MLTNLNKNVVVKFGLKMSKRFVFYSNVSIITDFQVT